MFRTETVDSLVNHTLFERLRAIRASLPPRCSPSGRAHCRVRRRPSHPGSARPSDRRRRPGRRPRPSPLRGSAASAAANSSRSSLPSPFLSCFATKAFAWSSVIGAPPPGRVRMPVSSSTERKPSLLASNAAKASRRAAVAPNAPAGATAASAASFSVSARSSVSFVFLSRRQRLERGDKLLDVLRREVGGRRGAHLGAPEVRRLRLGVQFELGQQCADVGAGGRHLLALEPRDQLRLRDRRRRGRSASSSA